MFEASEGSELEDDEMMLMVHVPLSMFGQAIFSDTFALPLLSVLTKVVVYAGIGTIDCYRACDVRGARVGCLIITLLISVLDVREGSISVE